MSLKARSEGQRSSMISDKLRQLTTRGRQVAVDHDGSPVSQLLGGEGQEKLTRRQRDEVVVVGSRCAQGPGSP